MEEPGARVTLDSDLVGTPKGGPTRDFWTASAADRRYDFAASDRFVYVFPAESVCGRGGLGAGRDVLLAGPSALGLVHATDVALTRLDRRR